MDFTFLNLEKISLPVLVAIIAGIASLIGATFSSITILISKWLDNKRYYRELLFRTALENWKRTCETLDTQSFRDREYPSFDQYLIHVMKLSKLTRIRNIKEKHIKKFIDRNRELNNFMNEIYRQKYQKD